jgi:diguanylate cyclase (GGDEF)-like protein
MAAAASPSEPEGLLEASWTERARRIEGRELRLELVVTATFLAAVLLLVLLAPPARLPRPEALAVVVAYALAARVQFAVGSGHVVPTQLFLLPLFALAPAQLVPLLVLAGLALSALGAAAAGAARADRLVYCGGDAMHALGPAVVLVALAGGDLGQAAAWVVVLAFAAQLAGDFASSALHDLVVFGVRPEVHTKVLAQVWGVDAALTPVALLTGAAASAHPWVALAPLPIVGLLSRVERDRNARIAHAHERLEALQRERGRLQIAVQRIGDAFASNLDLDALLELVTRASVEAVDADGGRASARPAPGREAVRRMAVHDDPRADPVLGSAERAALATGLPTYLARDGLHAAACPVGDRRVPVAVVSLVRDHAFTDADRALFEHLCGQAGIAALNVQRHERLHRQALTDELTGLANHRRLQEVLHAGVRRHAETGAPFGLVLLDIDDFKQVNDLYGHLTGDAVLRAIGRRMRQTCRAEDEPARYGGEELAVLVPDATAEGLEALAERLRAAVADIALAGPGGEPFGVTASLGVAMLGPEVASADALLGAADTALYEAKHSGKDAVRMAFA